MRLDVVILQWDRPKGEFAARQALKRPQTLFVDPHSGSMRRGDSMVKVSGLVCRCALSLACGAVVSLDEMADWEFLGRRDGGPDHARQIMRIAVREARAAMAALGYLTATDHGRGYCAKPLPLPRREEAA